MMEKQQFKGFALGILSAILWGVSGTFGQFLFQLRDISVEWLISVRMLITGVLLLLLCAFVEKMSIWSVWKNRNDLVSLFVFGIIGVLAVQYTYFAAIKHSNAATATVLQFVGPVMIAVYLALRHREMPGNKVLIAIFFALIGTFLLVTHGDFGSIAISGLALFYGLASAVTLAIYTLQPRRLMAVYPTSLVIGWGMLFGGIFMSFIHPPWQPAGSWDAYTYLYTAFIVIFGTLIPFYTYFIAVKAIGGQKTSLLTSAEPLAATLIAIVWLQVTFTTMDWIGSLCIISTVFLLGMDKSSRS